MPSSRFKNVAILGGSFNPPTTGHLQLAWQILKSCPIDEVWLSPVYSHNHGKNLALTDHRLAMCELACKQDSRFKTFNYEIRHQIEGGTYNFISKLLSDQEYQHCRFHYIIGLDVANEFHRWTRFQDLQNLIPFLVHPRKGEIQTEDWFLKPPHRFIAGENEVDQISSTIVRKLVKDKRSTNEYNRPLIKGLPPEVLQYIETNHLYE